MQIMNTQSERSTPFAAHHRKREGGSFRFRTDRETRILRSCCRISVVLFLFLGLGIFAQGQTISFAQGSGALVFSGGASPYSTSFGANGLGIAPAAGFNVIAVSAPGGYFYYTPYTIVLTGSNAGHPAKVSAYISANFANPTSLIQLESCANPGPCTARANYTNMPTTQLGEISVLPQQTANGSFIAYLGLFVADFNGSLTRTDSATINFDVIDVSHGTTTVKLNLSVTVEEAVQLQLATASGATITANAPLTNPDFTTNFGTVNGLGIGTPGAGVSVVTGQVVANGSLYGTPYSIQPAFSGFTSTSGTDITTYVNSNFTHSAILKLYDSGSANSGYGLISTSVGGTTISNSVGNGTNITRYLGLFVSNANGAGSFTGSDVATLTYTLTVQ